MFPTAVTVGFQGLGMLERWNVALQKLGSFFPKYFLRPCWVASVTKTTILLPHPRWMTYSFHETTNRSYLGMMCFFPE
jgi:hypothetical protein